MSFFFSKPGWSCDHPNSNLELPVMVFYTTIVYIFMTKDKI